jgi:hypothetical protein
MGNALTSCRCAIWRAIWGAFMTWFVSHPDKYRHALKEIPKQRDRGAAIIATAILEEHLLEAIQSRLERHAHTEKKMFNNDGALCTFSARIDLGVLIGLYPELFQRKLHLIRRIRNNFAHSMQPVSFKSQAADCRKLLPARGSHRGINKLLASYIGRANTPFSFTMFRSSTNPRTQFIRAIQQACGYLSLQIALAGMQGAWEKQEGRAPQPLRDKPGQLDLPLAGT